MTRKPQHATQSLLLRLPAQQRAALKDAAQAMDLSESAYLRRALNITLRLDAFTTEPTPYHAWFRDGLSEVFAAANLAAASTQALLVLARERMMREAMDRERLPKPLAQEQVDLALENALTAGLAALADPDTQVAYRTVVEEVEPDEQFWAEVDHGRKEE